MDNNSKKRPSKESKKQLVFPEWIDADVNTEKWIVVSSKDLALLKTTRDGKRDSKGSAGFFYQDPDGLVPLPRSLKVAGWKRISQLFMDDEKEPVITPENEDEFEFLRPNIHLFKCEFMRNLISQIIGMFNLNKIRPIVPEPVGTIFVPTESTPWKPWHHIYCSCKAGKIPHRPIYTNHGKYIVRLYLMGCWRKIYVDDLIPFDSENRLLLPTTTNKYEIWPLILFKAFLKLGYAKLLNYSSAEVEFFCIIPSLTTWQPEYRKIFKCHPEDIWNVLNRCLPKYKFPDDKHLDMDEKKTKSIRKIKTEQRTSKVSMKITAGPTAEVPLGDISDLVYNPDLIMCVIALIRNDTLLPTTKEELKEMDDILQHHDLCSSLSSTIFLNQIRDCPLEPPPPVEEIPKYKLIRRHLWDRNYHRKHRVTNPKIQSIYIQSTGQWINYRTEEKFPQAKDILEPYKFQPISTVIKILEEMIDSIYKAPFEIRNLTSDISITKESIMSSWEEKDSWMDLKDFCKCFRSIVIFHNTAAYNYYYKAVDPRLITAEGPFSKEKRQQKDVSNSQTVPLQTKISNYIFADYPSPKILFLSFFSIRDIYRETHASDSDENKIRKRSRKSMLRLPEELEFEYGVSALQLEEYFFKTLMHSYVILNLRPPFGRGIGISLPAGRTVLRVTVHATNPTVFHLWSSTPFLYGDEDLILPQLTTESVRFTMTSNIIFNQLLECLGCYDSPYEFQMSMLKLRALIFPEKTTKEHTKAELTTIFNRAFYSLIEHAFDRNLSLNMFFAIRCITLDATKSQLFKKYKYSELKAGLRRSSVVPSGSHTRKSRLKSTVKPFKDDITPDTSMESSYSNMEAYKKIVFIQSLVRRLIAKRMVESRIAGSKENIYVTTIALKILSELEKSPEENCNYFLRILIETSPTCMSKFPFYEDEKQRISFEEFTGEIPSLAPYSWIVVFRDIFYCKENVELVPRVYADNCNCDFNVTIINNDNLEMTPLLFLNPQHSRYVPNNSGYTILIEAASKDKAVLDCEWKLRIITDPSANIQYASQEIFGTSSLSVKEIAEYYIPNKHNVVARFNIKCFADSLITLQYLASNPNVSFIANLYKNDELIKAICKRGIIVFPAVLMRESEKGDLAFGSTTSHEDINKLCLEILVKPDSWLVSFEDSFFLINLQLKERTEINVFDHLSADDAEVNQPSPQEKTGQKKHKSKILDAKVDESMDFTKPHYMIRVIVDTSALEFIEIKKDLGFLEEFRALKRAWEEADPGRALRALAERRTFLQMFLDLPPPGADTLEYRRAIDYRLANDIRNERLKQAEMRTSMTSETLSTTSKTSATFDFQPTAFLPPSPITIIPLKPLNVEQFIRRSETQRLKTYFLEDQQQAIDNYKQQQERKILRRQQIAEIRKTEKIVLIEKSQFLMRSRPVPLHLCGAHSIHKLSYSSFEQKYLIKTRR